ncbi:MAG TPA: hypothetical protein VE986_05395 [Hyphomicrobiales bacterium]|nr:hypothetical protein [Hyphomicrobiales bacterium]
MSVEIETPQQRQKISFEEQLRALTVARNMIEKLYSDWEMQKRASFTKDGRDRHLAALDAVIATLQWMQENDAEVRGLARELAMQKRLAAGRKDREAA